MGHVERRICAGTTIRLPLDAVYGQLVADPAVIFSGDPQPLGLLDRQVTATLELQVSAAAAHNHEIVLTYGSADRSAEQMSISVRWHSSRGHQLFPSFWGTLWIRGEEDSTRLELVGVSHIPLGRYGDGQAGRHIAREAVAAQLRGIAGRLDSEPNLDRACHR